MNHDITHCRGIGCPIKEECFRYEAHLEVENGKYKSYMIPYYKDGLCKRAEKIKANYDDNRRI